MVSFPEYKDAYDRNWADLQIRPSRRKDAQRQAQRLLQGKQTYQQCENRTGVPWWFVGLCHYRESDLDFNTYLGNGQHLSQRTTIVPKGRGPFLGPHAFVDGAVDALRIQGFLGAKDWGIARVLYRLEGFNGYGYHGRGVNSPYLYGGSTAYGPPESKSGKYVRDHVFDPNFVDPQLGTAVILKELMELDSSIKFDGAASMEPETPQEPDDEGASSIQWLQHSLNSLGVGPVLTEDGKNGPRTMAALSQFQKENGLLDTGIADAATISTIERKLKPATTGIVDNALIQRLEQLEKIIGGPDVSTVGTQTRPPVTTAPSTDITGLLEKLMAIVQGAQAQGGVPTPSALQLAGQLRQATDLLTAMIAPGTADKTLPLGQVNGAFGETLGNLLNGKKTAIGIIGALLTSVLSQVPAGSGLGQVLAMLTPAAGLSPYTMPLFLAVTAWGALGKLEKWAQGTAPPPQLPK